MTPRLYRLRMHWNQDLKAEVKNENYTSGRSRRARLGWGKSG